MEGGQSNTTSFSLPNLRLQEVREKYTSCLESIVHVAAQQGLMLQYKVSAGTIKQSSYCFLLPVLKLLGDWDIVLLATKFLLLTLPNS